jgi:hypothetical protein
MIEGFGKFRALATTTLVSHCIPEVVINNPEMG